MSQLYAKNVGPVSWWTYGKPSTKLIKIRQRPNSNF